MINFVYMHFSPDDFGAFQTNFAVNGVPQYQFMSMNQTRFLYAQSRIIFICNPDKMSNDQKKISEDSNIELFDYRNIDDEFVSKYLTEISRSHGKLIYDPFYRVTLLRYIYSEYLMKRFSLDNIFFIEGDNILYLDENRMNDILSGSDDTFITCGRTGPGYYSSGVFYCSSVDKLHIFNTETIKMIKIGHDVDDMSIIHLLKGNTMIGLKEFPCLPDSGSTILFDPASYGQFLGGDNHEKNRGYIHPKHLIGQFLINHRSEIKFKRNESGFFMEYNGTVYEFANLHIHNKDAIKEFITHG